MVAWLPLEKKDGPPPRALVFEQLGEPPGLGRTDGFFQPGMAESACGFLSFPVAASVCLGPGT